MLTWKKLSGECSDEHVFSGMVVREAECDADYR
jgi:hypothetical protein